MKWISVKDRLPDGLCLVYLEEEMLGRRIHSASYGKNINLIGCQFYFDAPKPTHWMELPAPPTESEDK